MSTLTMTALRLGLLVLLWAFIFSIMGVLRTDIFGTKVSRRSQRRARKAGVNPAPLPAPVGVPARAPAKERGGLFGRGRAERVPLNLVVTEGPLTGTSLPLRATGILIGRNPECALVLDDDYASGRHCRIYQDGAAGGSWFVEDLGSTNGTFIGRDKLTTPRKVEVGTTLRIGQTVLELQD